MVLKPKFPVNTIEAHIHTDPTVKLIDSPNDCL